MLVRSVLATSSLLVAGHSALAADAANKNRRLNKRKKKGPKGNFRSKDEEVDEEAVAVDAAFDTAHKSLINGNQPKDVSTLPLKGVFEKGRPRNQQLVTTRKLLEAPLSVVACDPAAKDKVDDILGSVCFPDEKCVPVEGSSTDGVCLKATRAIDRTKRAGLRASTRKEGGKNKGKMNGDFCFLPPGLADELGDDIAVPFGVVEYSYCDPQSDCIGLTCWEAYDYTSDAVGYVATSKGYGGGFKYTYCYRNVYNIDDFDNGDPDICYQEVCEGYYSYYIGTTAGITLKEGCTFTVDGEECYCFGGFYGPGGSYCRYIDCYYTKLGTYTDGCVSDSSERFEQLFPKLVNNECGGASGKKGASGKGKGGNKRDRRLKK